MQSAKRKLHRSWQGKPQVPDGGRRRATGPLEKQSFFGGCLGAYMAFDGGLPESDQRVAVPECCVKKPDLNFSCR